MMSRAQAVAAYRSQATATHQLVEKHLELVVRIARHVLVRMPDQVELDDLVQAGNVGLIAAARTFQDGQGASFETYAGIRIRGAIMDELRKGDWVPRSVRRQYRVIVNATRQVEQRTGRAATAQEIADGAGMPLADYLKASENSHRGLLISLDLHMDENDGEPRLANHAPSSPGQEFDRHAFSQALAGAIAGLPEREQLVLSLYYEQELGMREAGVVMGIGESRVSQLHGQAMLRLRARLQGWEMADTLAPAEDPA